MSIGFIAFLGGGEELFPWLHFIDELPQMHLIPKYETLVHNGANFTVESD